MINCLILDDEQHAIDLLKQYIADVSWLSIADASTSAADIIPKLHTKDVHLLFLDINMPRISGMELMQNLPNRLFQIVVTSAYPEYALPSFDYQVTDYLLKPYSFGRFLRAVEQVRTRVHPLQANSDQSAEYFYVTADVKGKSVKVNFNEIQYIQAMNNYISIYTKTERIISLLTMKDIEQRLIARGFLRTHRSYIVAISAITTIEGNRIFLKDRSEIPLGETYKGSFFSYLSQHTLRRSSF